MPHRLQALYELLVRYRKVFRHFWSGRRLHPVGTYRPEEAEFLPAALALQETPLNPGFRWTGRLLILMLASLVLWAIFGKVDIVVTAQGKVIPSSRVKSIASIDVASVHAIHVQDGQHVKAGEVLIELDATAADSALAKADNEAVSGVIQVARAEAMIRSIATNVPPTLILREHSSNTHSATLTRELWDAEQRHVEEQFRDYISKLQRLDAEIERINRALPIALEQEADYRKLDADHDVAHHAALAKQQARIDLDGQLANARLERAALVAETRKRAFDQISEAKRLADSARQDVIRLSTQSRLFKLKSPVDGTVQQLGVHTVGGVVPAAQPLLQIIPDENLIEIEAEIANKDIGFVRSGHDAQVKVDTFDYSKYGTMSAKVRQVSADAVPDEKKGLVYKAKVVLTSSNIAVDGRNVPLIPGMTVVVDIKTGRRRLVEYFLSPLVRHQREALHER